MATVTIKYTGPIVDEIRQGMSIPRYFAPTNSYVDSPVYTEGFANGDGLGDDGKYGKSIYATNVDGLGFLPGLIPMYSNTTKFAQFERAIIAAKAAKDAGGENTGISFEITGYEEEIYWSQVSKPLADQGFEVTVDSSES